MRASPAAKGPEAWPSGRSNRHQRIDRLEPPPPGGLGASMEHTLSAGERATPRSQPGTRPSPSPNSNACQPDTTEAPGHVTDERCRISVAAPRARPAARIRSTRNPPASGGNILRCRRDADRMQTVRSRGARQPRSRMCRMRVGAPENHAQNAQDPCPHTTRLGDEAGLLAIKLHFIYLVLTRCFVTG
jgi:hypothetical protein